jgi:hypothetical protein
MKIILIKSTILIFLHTALLSVCFSLQDTTSVKPIKLTLTDGSELIGTVVGEDSVSIFFKTVGHIPMTIPRNQVRTIEQLSGQIIGGAYVRPDPNQTRLLFAPTARPLKSGQGYFSAYQIFFPFLAFGIADFLTLAGGMSLIPGTEGQLLYIAPKVTPIQSGNLSAAAGVLYITATSGGTDGVGIIYGVGTYGTQNSSLTGGLGWGFYGDDIADKPILMVGGELRASNSVKFITENWIPPDADIALLSIGIRFFGESLAADIGLIYPAGSEISGFPFIPWLGFAYNFGTPKQ